MLSDKILQKTFIASPHRCTFWVYFAHLVFDQSVHLHFCQRSLDATRLFHINSLAWDVSNWLLFTSDAGKQGQVNLLEDMDRTPPNLFWIWEHSECSSFCAHSMIHNFSAHLKLPWPFQACWWPNRELCKLKTNFFATRIFFTRKVLWERYLLNIRWSPEEFPGSRGREVERSRGRDLAWQVAFGIRNCQKNC